MKKRKIFAGAIGALMLLGSPSCGQAPAAPEEASFTQNTPVSGQINEVILDGTASRLPVSASISMGNAAASFRLTEDTLFLDGMTGERLPPSSLLEARNARIYPAEGSQPPAAEAVLIHAPEGVPAVHLHTAEEIFQTEKGLLLSTDGGSLRLFIPNGSVLSFYADGASATPEAIQPGDRVFAWYEGIEETYPAQTQAERLVIVPALESLPETLPEGLSFSVIPGSVTPEGASFRLWHNTNAQIQYGSDFTLQKLQNGEWHDLPYAIENGAFTMEAYHLPKGEPRTLEIRWDWLYGGLAPGEYRLAKTVTDFRGTGDFDSYTVAAAFTVGERIIICE